MATTASAMIKVASQPRILSWRLMVKRPMISGRTAISIITTMIGTEITPLITALQISARTGGMLRPAGHCDYCEYLTICGKDRVQREERKAGDPRVRHFMRITEFA